jgi:hypothetical protein
MNGIAEYGERVVVVEVHGGRVNLTTGCISSTDASHVEADNRLRTVVRSDRRIHPNTDVSDDKHERAYKVSDIHLLKEREAKSLSASETVQDWFGCIYQDHLVAKIQRALKRLAVE